MGEPAALTDDGRMEALHACKEIFEAVRNDEMDPIQVLEYVLRTSVHVASGDRNMLLLNIAMYLLELHEAAKERRTETTRLGRHVFVCSPSKGTCVICGDREDNAIHAVT